MFGTSWRIGRIAGVDLRVDASWLLIAALITYGLFLRFDALYPSLTRGVAVALGVLTTVLFFASVLLHELAHAIASKRRGIPVRGITLFLFGGATHAKLESRGPVDELIVTGAGPATSFALSGAFWLVHRVLTGDVAAALSGGVFGYLAWINLVLGLFNLLPGFPLDGGRILRALLWRGTGDLHRATRIAARAGQVVGAGLAALGILSVLVRRDGGGLWLALIGWFLFQAASASFADVRMRRLLEEVDASEVMAPNLVTLPADLPIREAVDRYFMRYDYGAFPVQEGSQTIGLVTLRSVRRMPREAWAEKTVWDAMIALDEAIAVAPATPMPVVLRKLEREDVHRVLVMDDHTLVGMITPADVAAWVRRRDALA